MLNSHTFLKLLIFLMLFVLAGCSSATITSPLPTPVLVATQTATATTTPSPVPSPTSSATPHPVLHGRIAFTDVSHSYSSLGLLDLADSSIQSIGSETGASGSLSWSPDGQWITFAGLLPKLQTVDIFVISSNGNQTRRLTNGPPAKTNPAWSPDGKFILYESAGGLALVSANGKINYKLAYPTEDGYDGYPSWSPDGKHIAYLYRKLPTSPNELWLMDSQGHNLSKVTNIPVNMNSQIGWSPDGEWIAFVSLDNLENGTGNECGDIYIVKPNGSNLIRLTNLSNCATSVSWSPDGSRIAFIGRNRKGGDVMELGWQIYVMDANGQNIVPVTNESKWVLYSLAWDPSTPAK